MWEGVAARIVQTNQFPSINSQQNLDLTQICSMPYMYCVLVGDDWLNPTFSSPSHITSHTQLRSMCIAFID
jgi:hypothetical protein